MPRFPALSKFCIRICPVSGHGCLQRCHLPGISSSEPRALMLETCQLTDRNLRRWLSYLSPRLRENYGWIKLHRREICSTLEYKDNPSMEPEQHLLSCGLVRLTEAIDAARQHTSVKTLLRPSLTDQLGRISTRFNLSTRSTWAANTYVTCATDFKSWETSSVWRWVCDTCQRMECHPGHWGPLNSRLACSFSCFPRVSPMICVEARRISAQNA